MRFKKKAILFCFILLCSWRTKDISIFPDSPKCGDTLKITLAKVSPQEKIIADFDKENYPFYPNGKNSQRCLIGLAASFTPGKYKISLFHVKEETKKQIWQGLLEIKPGIFPKKDLKFNPQKSKLVSHPQNKFETKKLRQILKGKTSEQLWQGIFQMPLKGKITAGYGTYRTIAQEIDWGQHKGIDIAASYNALAVAANQGIVSFVEEFILYGKTVVIDHGQGVKTIYMHLSSVVIHPGDVVEQGELIGRIGSTGLSTGTHLHWGLYIHGVAVEPLNWIKNEY